MNDMESMHEILNAIYLSSEKDVLATIIHVEGSAYRREGASMLFKEDGTKIGLLSAGCLETDLAYHVHSVIESGLSQTVIYDMRAEDDLSWGQGAGCNGVIHILLEPIDHLLREHLCRLKFHLDRGDRVTQIKFLDKSSVVSDYLFIVDEQTLFGNWHNGVSLHVRNLIDRFHQSPHKSGITYSSELSSNLYVHSIEPKPRLIIFGAGEDAISLATFANQTGFSCLVSDWRPTLCNEAFFPNADQLLVGFPEEVLNALSFRDSDSVVILTHHFQRDKELLDGLKNKELAYLGVLGSKNRTERLLNGEEIPPEISSPVGLSIGAEGPQEIAISIMAELIQQQKRRKEGIRFGGNRARRDISCCW